MTLLLPEIAKCQILVADHQPDFALMRLAPQASAKAPKLVQTIRVSDVCGCGVTVNYDRLILDEHATHLVVAPYALGSWKRSGSAK
jgi:hypothetical protein